MESDKRTSIRCPTKKIKILSNRTSAELFYHLYHNIAWEQSIPSRNKSINNGFTRMGASLSLDDERLIQVLPYLLDAVELLKPEEIKNYQIVGVYCNLYENGTYYTPNHSHPGQHQIVLSLGATRTLKVGKKDIQ